MSVFFARKLTVLDTYHDLLKLVLPELLVSHFDLVKSTKNNEILHLYFEEHNKSPEEFKDRILVGHGFHKELTIQDFPLRGNTVYLHIKRKRWMDKDKGLVVQRDWNLVAQGTRMTSEFAAFLKEISRYESE